MCSLATGHRMVADAISMLRLRFGEPVRFKFLIGQCWADPIYLSNLILCISS